LPEDIRAPFRIQFDNARDPYTARNALGIAGTGAGLITSVSSPLAVTGGNLTIDLSGYQPLDADLTAIAALTGTNTIYYRSAANTWSAVTIGTGLSFAGGTLAASGSTNPAAVLQIFTASGTYTPNAAMRNCIIECIGGGGAGGGSVGTAGHCYSGGGGGSGAYSRSNFAAATIGASQSVTIGAGGTGVVAANGNAGGATSVGALVGANGGTGGTSSSGTPALGAGGAGGAIGTGQIAFRGAPGANGIWSQVAVIQASGAGGASAFGGGGVGVAALATSANGNAASNYGSGGSGGFSQNTTSSSTGGNGSAGIVIITEFL